MSSDTYYDFHPFQGLTQNQREWYTPEFLEPYRRLSIFRQYVPHQVDLSGVRTKKMHFNFQIDPTVNVNPIGDYQLWIDPLYMESSMAEITTERHGDKVQLGKYDDYVTYWEQNGSAGLANIIRKLLAPNMTRKLDRLARNAFYQGYYTSVAEDPAKAGDWSKIVDGDVFQLSWIDKLNLQFASLDTPGFDGTPGSMVAIVSPGALYAIKTAAGNAWTDTRKYTEAGFRTLVTGEVGQWHGTRFVPTNDAILFNAGAITKRNTVTVALNPGDGAVATWKGRKIGQGAAVHTVTLGGAAFVAGDYNVGDIVTIHTALTSAHGVVDGVDPYDGQTQHYQIAEVDVPNQKISFTEPVTAKYTTDLGGGVYAYITRGRNVHASLFIAQPGAVVAGLIQPPTFHTPVSYDDFEYMWRFSWDAWIKYQPFMSKRARVVFHAGQADFGYGVKF